jgi:hypothetical protein
MSVGRTHYQLVMAATVLTLLLAPGCILDPLERMCTRSKPDDADFAGRWVPSQSTLNDMRSAGRYDTSRETILTLNADHTFELENMPDWWNNLERTPDRTPGQSHGAFISYSGKWQTSSVLRAPCWGIELNTALVSTTIDLLNQGAPYSIYTTIGDPDERHRMVLVRMGEPGR